jgi:hypothetical protein
MMIPPLCFEGEMAHRRWPDGISPAESQSRRRSKSGTEDVLNFIEFSSLADTKSASGAMSSHTISES